MRQGHYGLVESKPGFGAVPFDEFANGVIVGPLRAQGGQAIENRRFRLFRDRVAQDSFRSALAFVFRHLWQSARIADCSAPVMVRPPYAGTFLSTYARLVTDSLSKGALILRTQPSVLKESAEPLNLSTTMHHAAIDVKNCL